jgi:DNA-binding response OmpR family regulator
MTAPKVLIVDDEAEFASALAERLQIRGYDAKAVYCAEEAIACGRSETPDAVLLDLKMPGMNGVEILKIMRQFDPDVQVIILTGMSEEHVRAEGLEGRIFCCITKPVDINELTRKIDDAVKQRTAQRSKRDQ